MFYILCVPAPIVLFCILLNKLLSRDKKPTAIVTKGSQSSFEAAMGWLTASSIISPGIPLFLFHEWSKSAGASSGVIFIYILPIAWIFAFIGTGCLLASVIKKTPTDNNP